MIIIPSQADHSVSTTTTWGSTITAHPKTSFFWTIETTDPKLDLAGRGSFEKLRFHYQNDGTAAKIVPQNTKVPGVLFGVPDALFNHTVTPFEGTTLYQNMWKIKLKEISDDHVEPKVQEGVT